MRNYRINIDKRINELIPHYLGGRKFILFVQSLLHPLKELSDNFYHEATEIWIASHITSQPILFEWWLNRKFNKYLVDPYAWISIIEPKPTSMVLYREGQATHSDGSNINHLVLENEGSPQQTQGQPVTYYENQEITTDKRPDIDFIVIVPKINIAESEFRPMIESEVNKFKTVSIKHKIQIQKS